MTDLRIRYLSVVLLLAITAFVVNGLHYEPSQNDRAGFSDLRAIPMQIGKQWRGEDLPLEEVVYDILETRTIIHRLYSSTERDIVFLSIVHYQDTKMDFHAPESCFGGRGLKTIKKTKAISFLVGDQKVNLNVAEMTTTKESGQVLSYYFYKSGRFTGSNYIKMRFNVAVNKLVRGDARGSLIRIATVLVPGKKAQAEAMLTGFLRNIFPYVQQSL